LGYSNAYRPWPGLRRRWWLQRQPPDCS